MPGAQNFELLYPRPRLPISLRVLSNYALYAECPVEVGQQISHPTAFLAVLSDDALTVSVETAVERRNIDFKTGLLAPGELLTFKDDSKIRFLALCQQFVKAISASSPGSGRDINSLQDRIHDRISPALYHLWLQLSSLAESADDPLVRLSSELLVFGLLEKQPTALTAADDGLPPEIDPVIAGPNLQSLRRAMEAIDDQLTTKLSIHAVAAAAGMSTFHFSRIFRAATGKSVHGMIINKRLLLVHHLVSTSELPLSTIAFDTGFSSQSHMTTAFRKRFGFTPAVCRSRSRGQVSRSV